MKTGFEIAFDYKMSDMALYEYHKAYVTRCALEMLEVDLSDDDKKALCNLAEFAYLKSSDQYADSFYYDALVRAINDGVTVDDLKSLNKFKLLQLCRDYML